MTVRAGCDRVHEKGEECDVQGSSSANMGLVLYQYRAPTARPHLAAVPFHVYLLSAGAVLANLRPAEAIVDGCRNARGVDRTAARNIVEVVVRSGTGG